MRQGAESVRRWRSSTAGRHCRQVTASTVVHKEAFALTPVDQQYQKHRHHHTQMSLCIQPVANN
jgi:hypothetical protein